MRGQSLLLTRPVQEAAQPVGDVVGQLGAAELAVRLNPPHRKLSHIQLHPLKREQQVCEAVVLECGCMFKFGAIQQDSFLGEQIIDAVHPFLKVAAAALEDQPPHRSCAASPPWSFLGSFDLLALGAFLSSGQSASLRFQIGYHWDIQFIGAMDLRHIPSVTGP